MIINQRLDPWAYIVLNPVRARMVRKPENWPWSSYRATVGLDIANNCLTTDWILSGFGRSRKLAQEKYMDFVRAGRNQPAPWGKLKNQIYLGSDDFVKDVQCKMPVDKNLTNIPKCQKQAPQRPLSDYAAENKSRDKTMALAYKSGHYTLQEIGDYFGVSIATVSRANKKFV